MCYSSMLVWECAIALFNFLSPNIDNYWQSIALFLCHSQCHITTSVYHRQLAEFILSGLYPTKRVLFNACGYPASSTFRRVVGMSSKGSLTALVYLDKQRTVRTRTRETSNWIYCDTVLFNDTRLQISLHCDHFIPGKC